MLALGPQSQIGPPVTVALLPEIWPLQPIGPLIVQLLASETAEEMVLKANAAQESKAFASPAPVALTRRLTMRPVAERTCPSATIVKLPPEEVEKGLTEVPA